MRATLKHPPSTFAAIPGSGAVLPSARARLARGRSAPRVTSARLLEILNGRLAAHPSCGGMRLGGQRWETAERAGRCNWPETCLVVRVHGTTAPGAWAGLREVIAGVRAEFDLLLPTA